MSDYPKVVYKGVVCDVVPSDELDELRANITSMKKELARSDEEHRRTVEEINGFATAAQHDCANAVAERDQLANKCAEQVLVIEKLTAMLVELMDPKRK